MLICFSRSSWVGCLKYLICWNTTHTATTNLSMTTWSKIPSTCITHWCHEHQCRMQAFAGLHYISRSMIVPSNQQHHIFAQRNNRGCKPHWLSSRTSLVTFDTNGRIDQVHIPAPLPNNHAQCAHGQLPGLNANWVSCLASIHHGDLCAPQTLLNHRVGPPRCPWMHHPVCLA